MNHINPIFNIFGRLRKIKMKRLIPLTYTDEKGKNKTIKVKHVSISSPGLMFRKRSPPLLFDMGSVQSFAIHSLFCNPFKAIWLDDKKKISKVVVVKRWKLNLRGEGRYLLEIPINHQSHPSVVRAK